MNMSEDDIPEGLRSGSEGPPEGFEDTIEDCVRSRGADLTLKGIHPTDKMEYFSGNYEQRYNVRVSRLVNGAEKEGIAVVDAYKQGGEWQADLVRIDIQ